MINPYLLTTSSAAALMSVCLMVIAAPPAEAQQITEFVIPTAGSAPTDIATGSDGALWFTETAGDKIGRITAAGVITEFPITTVGSNPVGIVAGPDGALWFAEAAGNKIGRITTAGVVTEFPVTTVASQPNLLTVGPDGAIWFTELNGEKIGRITTAGVITEFVPPTASDGPLQIVQGSDGNLWFTEAGADKIARITPAGVITEFPNPEPTNAVGTTHAITPGPDGRLYYTDAHNLKIGVITTGGVYSTETPIPSALGGAQDIAIGPDGAIWFAEPLVNKIARAGAAAGAGFNFTEFNIPTPGSTPTKLVAGPDGNLWFTENNGNQIGRLTPPASPTSLVAAVLPASRSVQVGATATAFATIINGGSAPLANCGIVPLTPIPAGFSYQATNSSTNAVTGAPNTPVAIAAGAPQSFVIALPANAPFIPTNVVLGFDCAGSDPVQPIVGVNTLLLSASSSPVPDIVALGATPTGNGILDIHGSTGSAAFAVATVNVGTADVITASVDTGSASLPVTLTICQSNPVTAACLSPPAPTVSATIAANATPTFSIFATGSGVIAFAPAKSRLFVRFKDAAGVTRGSTSVAVETK